MRKKKFVEVGGGKPAGGGKPPCFCTHFCMSNANLLDQTTNQESCTYFANDSVCFLSFNRFTHTQLIVVPQQMYSLCNCDCNFVKVSSFSRRICMLKLGYSILYYILHIKHWFVCFLLFFFLMHHTWQSAARPKRSSSSINEQKST
jgi:hypothetical protein